jgi:hypothetical protein
MVTSLLGCQNLVFKNIVKWGASHEDEVGFAYKFSMLGYCKQASKGTK